MTVLGITFWILVGIVFYSYLGYALLMLLFARKKSSHYAPIDLPDVTLVIASYNEGTILDQKIKNTLSLDYPAGKLTVLVVTDGSDDNSLEILARYPSIKVLHQPERQGKAAAINRAMSVADTSIVVFTDANTLLNTVCLQKLLPHFRDEKTGAVAGEKKLLSGNSMGDAEGWYWKYESFMKTLDARFYSVVGAAGELFALRKSLFVPFPADTLLDDFVLSLHVCLSKYIVAYEPDAFAVEAPSASLHDERKRKVRIAAGAFQTISRLSFKKLFSVPLFTFQFISRRWLRWVVCPFAIILILILNILLAFFSHAPVYDWILFLQLVFYLLAAVGWWLMNNRKALVITTIPFYFLFMNYCMIAGWLRWKNHKESVLWSKAERVNSDL
jgi:poly-beta-1,6-N-acetyl-D-glucosamine synthase